MINADEIVQSKILSEPILRFRYGQTMPDPHSGLELFGPYDADSSARPTSIPYALIGTSDGIASFKKWADQMLRPAISSENEENAALWPVFPGFEAVFQCAFPGNAAWAHILNAEQINKVLHYRDPNKRAYRVSDLYVDGINIADKKDEPISLVICIVPDSIWLQCRPLSTVHDGIGHRPLPSEKALRMSNLDLLDDSESTQYFYSVDFRRQLKARAMGYDLPTQIIRQSTLRLSDKKKSEERGLTPLSDRMWNLSTAFYYKAGGKPWRLENAREGVCYIGVSFKKADASFESRTACCAAQMFLDSGDGIVFMGESGPWYSPEHHQCHLTKEGAKKLLYGVLETYRQHEGKELKEIFLHYRSEINDEEFSGYREACPSNTKLVGIRVRMEKGGLKFFREGKMPIIRGTTFSLGDRSAYLWASGYKPSLGTYDGWEVPNPLRVDIQHGDADILEVTKDILGLTKLNYNACKLGDSEPVTIGFSDAVGEILVSNPQVTRTKPNFKYYM